MFILLASISYKFFQQIFCFSISSMSPACAKSCLWHTSSITLVSDQFSPFRWGWFVPGRSFVPHANAIPSTLNLTYDIPVAKRRYDQLYHLLSSPLLSCYKGWHCCPDCCALWFCHSVILNSTWAYLNFFFRLNSDNQSSSRPYRVILCKHKKISHKSW